MTNAENRKLKVRNKIISLFPIILDIQNIRDVRAFVKRVAIGGAVYPLPSLIKRSLIANEISKIDARNFVETGTYVGDTIWGLRKSEINIISIEIDHDLVDHAKQRFNNYKNISIKSGDSSVVLKTIERDLSQGRTVFWLDGHYSGGVTGRGKLECPILCELENIQQYCRETNSSILIDDARLFGKDKDYPDLLELRKYVAKLFPDSSMVVDNDIIKIRIEPSSSQIIR